VVVGCAASSVWVEEFVVDTLAATAAVVSARMAVAGVGGGGGFS